MCHHTGRLGEGSATLTEALQMDRAVVGAPAERRLTAWGEPAAERRVWADLGAIGDSLAARSGSGLRALLLVGGYARGEGGVVLRDGKPAPYNDYDLVAVVSGGGGRLRSILRDEASAWTERLGVDVDVWPISQDQLGRVPRTLFWLDVAMGGVLVVHGDPGVIGRLRPPAPREVPLEECARLLANRAVGIALSNLEHSTSEEAALGPGLSAADRRARHGHKAVLACGDARLLAADHYAGSVSARLRSLEGLESSPAVGGALVCAYRDASRFRERPDLWSPGHEGLDRWYSDTSALVSKQHLSFESWRVGTPRDPLGYAVWRGRIFAALPDAPWGSTVAAVRAAAAGAAPLRPWVGHPRERLARVAVALAYGADDVRCRAAAARLLGARHPADDGEMRERLMALVDRSG
jgi:hypothetical protein